VHLITESTSPREADRAATTAVLPVGSFEQHGAHLPLTTDTIIACAIAHSVAAAHNLFLLPPISISCSHEHAAWAGTVSIRATTLAAVVEDIATSLAPAGISTLVLVNAHGGNYVLSNITQQASRTGPRLVLFPSRADWDTARTDAHLATTAHDDMHAGELETSLLLHLCPELVGPDHTTADHLAERPHLLTLGLHPYAPAGVVGAPSKATAAKGGEILASLTRSFAATLAQVGT
jgi:creatinine amidohydrolase